MATKISHMAYVLEKDLFLSYNFYISPFEENTAIKMITIVINDLSQDDFCLKVQLDHTRE